MIALVGGDELGKKSVCRPSHVDSIFVTSIPSIQRDGRFIERTLLLNFMSGDVEAFRFDFCQQAAFLPETKAIEITATKEGPCYGVVQWIRLELGSVSGSRTIRHNATPSRTGNIRSTVSMSRLI